MEPGTTPASAMRSWVLPDEPVPVRLMNTIWADRAGVHDDLSTPTDLGAWLQSVADAERPPPVTRRQLSDARQLRDALRRIAAFVTADTRPSEAAIIADVDVAIEIVNRAATVAQPAPRLTRDRALLRTAAPADRQTVTIALCGRCHRRHRPGCRRHHDRAARLPRPRMRPVLRQGPPTTRVVLQHMRQPSPRRSSLSQTPLGPHAWGGVGLNCSSPAPSRDADRGR